MKDQEFHNNRRLITLSGGVQEYTLNDVDAVQYVASLMQISEFQIFHLAYEEWYKKKLSDKAMERHFNNYVEEDLVPLWVWDFVKRAILKHEDGKLLEPEVDSPWVDKIKSFLVVVSKLGRAFRYVGPCIFVICILFGKFNTAGIVGFFVFFLSFIFRTNEEGTTPSERRSYFERYFDL